MVRPCNGRGNTGPKATMHGLRFDNNRGTYFDKTFAKSSSQQFTVSAWVKITKSSKNFRVLTLPYSDSGKYTIFDISSVGELRWQLPPTSGDSSVLVVSTGSVSLNTWTHVVGSVNYADQSAKYKRCGCNTRRCFSRFGNYFDGLPMMLTQGIALARSQYKKMLNCLRHCDGYMSDVYFVEGTKDAETFGKSFEGKWVR